MHDQLNKFAMYTDEELMHFIINGEEFAFNELYKRYAKKLLGYFTRMLNYDKNLAEDALQDVFLKIAEAPTKFDNSRSFRTWVFLCIRPMRDFLQTSSRSKSKARRNKVFEFPGK